ncbi:MAG: hypothetical protein A2622_09470 [Bdellovibrionales bacterium RIFCSPHIGHO2_01_FULL_40_29]|nr:MAG: hypothetical protein A2622_09470 [Bdellovibrionales bacterium RIFCSPHIGHO2_01_FULL_40_29]OFZ33548.1 MAG: hypothetical protein A3D17_00150 [Bdellovibrionales bacterium RIFCSPHIGHO2_02_FULL_40_15]
MKRIRAVYIYWIVAAFAGVILFQNCSKVHFGQTLSEGLSKTADPGGGDPICENMPQKMNAQQQIWDWQDQFALSPDHQYPDFNLVAATPQVADLDATSHPKIVFVTDSEKNKVNGVLRIVDGSTGINLKSIGALEMAPQISSGVLLIDLDADLKIEIVYVHHLGKSLIALNHDGTLRWTFPFPKNVVAQNWKLSPLDMDQDGRLEIAAGDFVISEVDMLPTLKTTQQNPHHSVAVSKPSPIFADVDGNGNAEILMVSEGSVAGKTAASVRAFKSDSSCVAPPACVPNNETDCENNNGQGALVCSEGYSNVGGVCTLNPPPPGPQGPPPSQPPPPGPGPGPGPETLNDAEPECPVGTYKSGAACIPFLCTPNSTQSCSVPNGTGSQTCNAEGTAWGSCNTTACNAGYANVGGVCTLIQACTPYANRSCTGIYGPGDQYCNGAGTAWGNCYAGVPVNNAPCTVPGAIRTNPARGNRGEWCNGNQWHTMGSDSVAVGPALPAPVTVDGWVFKPLAASGMSVLKPSSAGPFIYSANRTGAIVGHSGDKAKLFNSVMWLYDSHKTTEHKISFKKPLMNGTYQLYFYQSELTQARSRTLNYIVEGTTIATGRSYLPLNNGEVSGPYNVKVSDGELNLTIYNAKNPYQATGCDPHLSGLIIKQLNAD